jgi:hypothetical protein
VLERTKEQAAALTEEEQAAAERLASMQAALNRELESAQREAAEVALGGAARSAFLAKSLSAKVGLLKNAVDKQKQLQAQPGADAAAADFLAAQEAAFRADSSQRTDVDPSSAATPSDGAAAASSSQAAAERSSGVTGPSSAPRAPTAGDELIARREAQFRRDIARARAGVLVASETEAKAGWRLALFESAARASWELASKEAQLRASLDATSRLREASGRALALLESQEAAFRRALKRAKAAGTADLAALRSRERRFDSVRTPHPAPLHAPPTPRPRPLPASAAHPRVRFIAAGSCLAPLSLHHHCPAI